MALVLEKVGVESRVGGQLVHRMVDLSDFISDIGRSMGSDDVWLEVGGMGG